MVGTSYLQLMERVYLQGDAAAVTRHKETEQELLQAQIDLKRLAHTDDLTGIPNRRHFLQQLDAELTRARRNRIMAFDGGAGQAAAAS